MSAMHYQTEKEKSVVIEKVKISKYGIADYKLANALNNTPGYGLTSEFKNAVGQLPSNYSIADYADFFDKWGTVSNLKIAC